MIEDHSTKYVNGSVVIATKIVVRDVGFVILFAALPLRRIIMQNQHLTIIIHAFRCMVPVIT